jgi:hypothetical protein
MGMMAKYEKLSPDSECLPNVHPPFSPFIGMLLFPRRPLLAWHPHWQGPGIPVKQSIRAYIHPSWVFEASRTVMRQVNRNRRVARKSPYLEGTSTANCWGSGLQGGGSVGQMSGWHRHVWSTLTLLSQQDGKHFAMMAKEYVHGEPV